MTNAVWLFNLDAELEVEARKPYAGPLIALTKRPSLMAQLGKLVPSGDVVLSTLPARAAFANTCGYCWSPTPSAVSALKFAGVNVVFALPAVLLRQVMSRAFSAGLGLHFEAANWFSDSEQALARVRLPSPSGRWLARRAFGFAGKARRAFREAKPADEAFVVRAAREGGVLIEPFVERSLDAGLHGYLAESGVVLGEPVINLVDEGGVFRESRRASSSDLSEKERAALVLAARQSATALSAVGYSGPFGIDGFRYRLGSIEGFQPRSEINARYSMAWAIGMGERRPDLDRGHSPSLRQ